MKRISGYIVMQGSAYTALHKGLGLQGGGILAPAAQATLFTSLKRAKRAVARTYRMASRIGPRLENTILDDWPKLRTLFARGIMTIVPLDMQGAPYVPKVHRPNQLAIAYDEAKTNSASV